jgi:hypothetical protein
VFVAFCDIYSMTAYCDVATAECSVAESIGIGPVPLG